MNSFKDYSQALGFNPRTFSAACEQLNAQPNRRLAEASLHSPFLKKENTRILIFLT
jgi:hypothetical protein